MSQTLTLEYILSREFIDNYFKTRVLTGFKSVQVAQLLHNLNSYGQFKVKYKIKILYNFKHNFFLYLALVYEINKFGKYFLRMMKESFSWQNIREGWRTK